MAHPNRGTLIARCSRANLTTIILTPAKYLHSKESCKKMQEDAKNMKESSDIVLINWPDHIQWVQRYDDFHMQSP